MLSAESGRKRSRAPADCLEPRPERVNRVKVRWGSMETARHTHPLERGTVSPSVPRSCLLICRAPPPGRHHGRRVDRRSLTSRGHGYPLSRGRG
jgi:hypothetical protein